MNDLQDSSFLHWSIHREQARLRRELGGLRPWSDCPVVSEYRFCNLSREDDRGTIELARYIRNSYNKYSDELSLLQMLIVGRMINLPDSFAEMKREGVLLPALPAVDFAAMAEVLRKRRDRGENVFSGAYMVASTLAGGKDKIQYVMDVASSVTKLPPSLTRPKRERTRAEVHEDLTNIGGLGNFLAGQIVADLAYTDLLRSAPDHRSWAPLGPGAAKGANLARGRVPNKLISHKDYLEVGAYQFRAIVEDSRIPEATREKLTMHDVASNVNCETFKYHRINTNPVFSGRKYKEKST